VIEAAVPEGFEVPVELAADAADLALGDAAGDAERLDEIIDLAGAHAVHVGLHDHREQRPIDPAALLQQRREERSLPQLRDLQLDVASRRRQQPGRRPLRCATRASDRSYGAAPMNAVASDSINCCNTHSRLVRIPSVNSPALSAASNSDRS
jgi:hypothetical protein